MSVSAALVTTNGTVVANDGSKHVDIGPGSIFTGPMGGAAFVQTSGDGSIAAAAKDPQAKTAGPIIGEEGAVPKDELTPEQSLGSSGSRAGTSGQAKPVKLGEMDDLIDKHIAAYAKKFGVESIVGKMQTNPFANRRQLVCTQMLNKLTGFDLSTKNVTTTPSPDFTAPNIMPYHIMGLVSLLTGEKKKDFSVYINLIKEVKSHIVEVCEDEDAIKQVTNHVFTEHAKTFHKTYHLLLHAETGVAGIGKERGRLIKRWILNIKSHASKYFETLRMQVMLSNMQQALLLQASDSDEGDKSDGENIPAAGSD